MELGKMAGCVKWNCVKCNVTLRSDSNPHDHWSLEIHLWSNLSLCHQNKDYGALEVMIALTWANFFFWACSDLQSISNRCQNNLLNCILPNAIFTKLPFYPIPTALKSFLLIRLIFARSLFCTCFRFFTWIPYHLRQDLVKFWYLLEAVIFCKINAFTEIT